MSELDELRAENARQAKLITEMQAANRAAKLKLIEMAADAIALLDTPRLATWEKEIK